MVAKINDFQQQCKKIYVNHQNMPTFAPEIKKP